MPPLETVDLEGVEILAAGGPIFGHGSPPEGDWYTVAELEAIAEANTLLAAEIKPPNKLGHSDKQQLLENSQISDGEKPAAGWLTNFRVEGEKLLADVKAVPKKLSELIESGAWRTRSVELSRVTSQELTDDDGKPRVFDWVVTGLAWLGGALPAVQTLDDVVALYAAHGVKLRRVYAAGDVVWDPTEGYMALRERVWRTLNAGLGPQEELWVRDITDGKALVEDGWGEDAVAYVVPWSLTDGEVVVAARENWIEAEQEWVQTASELAAKVEPGKKTRAAETRAMPELTLTEDAAAELAKSLGLDGDVTVEALTEAAQARANELAEAQKEPAEGDVVSVKDFEAVKTQAANAERKLFERDRDEAIGAAIKSGRLEPAKREEYEKRFEKDPDLTREFLAELPVKDELVREFGKDDDGTEEMSDEQQERFLTNRAERLGLTRKEMVG